HRAIRSRGILLVITVVLADLQKLLDSDFVRGDGEDSPDSLPVPRFAAIFLPAFPPRFRAGRTHQEVMPAQDRKCLALAVDVPAALPFHLSRGECLVDLLKFFLLAPLL